MQYFGPQIWNNFSTKTNMSTKTLKQTLKRDILPPHSLL